VYINHHTPRPSSFLRFKLVEYFATVASHPPLLLLILLLALLSSTNQIPFESVTIVFGDSFGVAATSTSSNLRKKKGEGWGGLYTLLRPD